MAFGVVPGKSGVYRGLMPRLLPPETSSIFCFDDDAVLAEIEAAEDPAVLVFRGSFAGLLRLLASPFMSRVVLLDLGGTTFGDEGAKALAASPFLEHLVALDLGATRMTDDGAKALAASSSMPCIALINLGNNSLSNAGVEALRQAFPGVDLHF